MSHQEAKTSASPHGTIEPAGEDQPKGLTVFEKYLSVWVILCILAGIVLGKLGPGLAAFLDGLAIYVNGAPVVSIPIAVCLFFMMYPIMVKIDFGEVVQAGKSVRPVSLTLFVNWAIKPFTMYFIALLPGYGLSLFHRPGQRGLR